jgi:flagellar basal body P-ring formation protein FlgA
MRRSARTLLAAAVAGFLAALGCVAASALEQKTLPVPAFTILPGDTIRDDSLVERAFAPNLPGLANVIDAKPSLVGRIARRTLLPGQPIPANAIDEPRMVTRGVTVKLIVEDGGLMIIAFGLPLQSGGVGALVRVRNVDTGVVVTGVVQPDGSVRAGNG